MNVPTEWFLGAFVAMAGSLASVASAAWLFLKSRLAAQDRIIENLQKDVERLSRGCGVNQCLWRNR